MGQVLVKLIGLGHKDASRESKELSLRSGETVETLWRRLKQEADPEKLLARIEPKDVLVHVNGRAVHLLNGWETPLNDEDRVVYMRMAFGG